MANAGKDSGRVRTSEQAQAEADAALLLRARRPSLRAIQDVLSKLQGKHYAGLRGALHKKKKVAVGSSYGK